MNDKYKNKYRIPSARLQNWDYRCSGVYFITICTAEKRCYFGEIENGKMLLSPVGIIADILWCEIKNHHKGVSLGEFVVIPNHIHGIIILDNEGVVNVSEDKEEEVSQYSKISPKSNSISAIVRSYKAAVTKHSRRLSYDFAWQTRFYDSIIRDENQFKLVSDYIVNNPINWDKDKVNSLYV